MAMTDVCEGSGQLRGFATGDRVNLSGARKQARVRCQACPFVGTGFVVRTSQGCDLGSDHVQVPRHKRRAVA